MADSQISNLLKQKKTPEKPESDASDNSIGNHLTIYVGRIVRMIII